MNTNERYLELQAYADGQLDQLEDHSPGRRAELERLIASDAEARAFVEGVRSVSQLLRANEPVHQVPESREFYWSQIQRRIESAERADGRAVGPAHRSSFSWRWLAPAFGLAAVTVAVVLASRGSLPGFQPLGEVAVSEQGYDASGAMVFRSESDGVTICWLD